MIQKAVMVLAALFAVNAVAASPMFKTDVPRSRPALPRAAERTRPLAMISPPARIAEAETPTLPATKSFFILDVRSGEPLLARSADEQRPIASLTKLATALVVVGMQPDWKERIVIQANDLREGSEPILIPGEAVTREELFAASLIGSSNVATAAIARATGLTADQFAARMNHVAETLGLHQTRFVEPTGLDERNVSTAREMAYLARAAFGDLRIQKYVRSPSVLLHPVPSKSPKQRLVKSTDALLFSDLAEPPFAFRGGKTGSLGQETGYHFAMMLGNGQRQDVVVVVLGSDTTYTRFDAARTLALWTFENYYWF